MCFGFLIRDDQGWHSCSFSFLQHQRHICVLMEQHIIFTKPPQDCVFFSSCFYWKKFSEPKTYFSEFDLLLVDHSGRGGAASAVHKPPSVSNQNHIRLVHRLRQATCQRVPHLVLQGSSVGIHLKTDLDVFRLRRHKLSTIKSINNFTLHLVVQELARQGPKGVKVEETT